MPTAHAAEIIVPKDEAHWLGLRAEDVTSTEAAALYGISPYSTLFETWHRKKDKAVVEIEINDRMKWGTRLQDSIAAGIAEDQGWKIRRMDEYMRLPGLKMGSSFDFAIEEEHEVWREPDRLEDGIKAGGIYTVGPYKAKEYRGIGLLEVKNVDSLAFMDGWLVTEDGQVEAPPHIELQVQHQLAVSGRSFAYIGALVGGNRVVLIKREPDLEIIEDLKKRVASFWFSIVSGVEPKPDFKRDAGFISRLYSYAEPGKIFAASDETFTTLMLKYKEAALIEKQAGEDKDAVKAQILMAIGDCEKVRGEGFSIDCGITAGGPVAYERKPYRRFKPSWKKEVK